MRMTLAEFLAAEARLQGKRGHKVVQDDAPENEAALHAKIIAHCKANAWIYFHGSMAHKTRRVLGEPDFVLLLPGCRVILVEAKGEKTKMSTEQLAMQAWCSKLGHVLHVVRSFDEFLQVVSA